MITITYIMRGFAANWIRCEDGGKIYLVRYPFYPRSKGCVRELKSEGSRPVADPVTEKVIGFERDYSYVDPDWRGYLKRHGEDVEAAEKLCATLIHSPESREAMNGAPRNGSRYSDAPYAVQVLQHFENLKTRR